MVGWQVIRRMDPAWQYMMVAAKQALKDANLLSGANQMTGAVQADPSMARLNAQRCGVIVGTGIGGMVLLHTSTVQVTNQPDTKHLHTYSWVCALSPSACCSESKASPLGPS